MLSKNYLVFFFFYCNLVRENGRSKAFIQFFRTYQIADQ